jgi:hypothetical protein
MKDGICFRSVIRRSQVNYALNIFVHHKGGMPSDMGCASKKIMAYLLAGILGK